MSNELQVAIEAAKAGARVALKYFQQNPEVTLKPDSSPVTKADKESEQVIKERVLAQFPNAHFLGEESGGEVTAGDLWVVDPLDGTKNFIRGLPFWAVEIALARNGKLIVGVSFCPILDEIMYAQVGKGTFLNSKKVSVSQIASVSSAFANHGTIIYFEEKKSCVLTLLGQVSRERGYADFYGYHLVATGRADIMLDAKNGPWDIAALKVIVEEAGGKVTNYEGKEWSLADDTAVATNGLLHDEVIRILTQEK